MINLLASKIKLNKADSLTTLVKKNALYSLVLKALSIVLSFWSVKVAFEFTGSQQVYGLWLTILSVLGWLALLNGGMGNGLRNKLSHSLAVGNYKEGKAYVSTSYTFIATMSGCFIIIFIVCTLFIDWRALFNARYISKGEFTALFSVVVISYFIQLTLSTVNAICFAFNRSTLPSLFTFLSNVLYVFSLYVLKYFHISGFLLLGFVYGVCILIILFTANIYLFSGEYKDYKPALKYFNKSYVKELMGNGIKFFFLEASAVIIFATDSMIITHVVGSKDVTVYQLVMKLFSIFTVISGTIMVPLWSAFTHAYAKEDIVWIKKTLNKIFLLLIPLVVGVVVLSFIVNPLLKIWIGRDITASNALIYIIAIYIVVNIWSNIFAYFLNGINRINGQLWTVGLGALLNIPLSIYLARNMSLGTVGVVLSTICCLLPFCILGPIQTWMIINKRFKNSMNSKEEKI
ncbi:MATE family efflux transporter [Priestia megaterium]|uniref:MATE family efflux transporter n=1 Tax=Priestia megaterium TaxID=1404 RepID=UPI002B24A0B8|nr:MATE family efflux transporter [Priestia megaterium]MEB2289967.1 hypothetical protein [Priestia megaterium]